MISTRRKIRDGISQFVGAAVAGDRHMMKPARPLRGFRRGGMEIVLQ